jgi:hypothetical protein
MSTALTTALRRAVALAFALASCAVPAAGVSFTHKDWSLACDNTGTCRAAGYQSEREENAVSVLLTRAPGPGTRVEAKVQFGSYGDDAPQPSGPVHLSVGGRPAGAVADSGSFTPAQVAAVLKALVGSGDVVFASDTTRWTLSGDGAAAVLLKMDAAQGRVSTPGAIAKKGLRAEATVPGAAAPPVIQAVRVAASTKDDLPLARRVLATIPKSEDCPEAGKGDADADLVELWHLGGARILVTAPCRRGAYNASNGWWVARDKPPYDAKRVTVLADTFLPDKGELSGAAKGRGLGDCLASATWIWDGHDFVPAAESTTGLCRLIAPGGAWELPTLVSDVRKPR